MTSTPHINPLVRWWRKRRKVRRQCWYCDGIYLFPKWPGLHGESPYNSWYCPRCRT